MGLRVWSVTDMGFVVDHEAAAYLRRHYDDLQGKVPQAIKNLSAEEFQINAKAGTLPENYSEVRELEDYMDSLDGRYSVCLKDFSGEVAFTNGEILEFKNQPLYYMTSEKKTSLFSAAYESFSDLLKEFKTKFSVIGLPEDFNWAEHVGKVNGTTFSAEPGTGWPWCSIL